MDPLPRRCPQYLFERIATGDEARRGRARAEVIAWVQQQRLSAGEHLIIPDPENGSEMIVAYDPRLRAQ